MSGLYLQGLFLDKSACAAALNFSNNDNESTFHDLFSGNPLNCLERPSEMGKFSENSKNLFDKSSFCLYYD
jgi:hypothetical protein